MLIIGLMRKLSTSNSFKMFSCSRFSFDGNLIRLSIMTSQKVQLFQRFKTSFFAFLGSPLTSPILISLPPFYRNFPFKSS